MLKGRLLYLSVFLLQNNIWAAGFVHGDCLLGSIKVGRLCYKWYSNKLNSLDAHQSCRETGGSLAGDNYNFAGTVNTDPLLQDFLPTNSCFRISDHTSRHSQSKMNLAMSSNYYIRLAGWIVSMIRDSEICHNGKQWKTASVSVFTKRYYVCEYGFRILQPPRQPSRRQLLTISRERESTLIIDSPFFNHVALLPTMCSRLCQRFTGCSVFNYNTVTNECRGFGHKDVTRMENHQEWEVWAVK